MYDVAAYVKATLTASNTIIITGIYICRYMQEALQQFPISNTEV
jgi:hypothetical protein